jgi:hypothetical protein
MDARTVARGAAALAIAAAVVTGVGARADAPQIVRAQTGHVLLEVVGQVNNSPAPAPLGSSTQFGYVSFLEGVDQLFSTTDPTAQNQSTAALTFFTDVATTRVTPNGPFSIIIREGTTTFYRNFAPADFSVPDSFRSGNPVLVSTIRQQVIVDTIEKTFTVTNVNVVTDTTPFELDGVTVSIGHRDDVLRTALVGVLKSRDGTPPPTGYFSGYAVAAKR